MRGPHAVLEHRMSVYDNMPDEQQLSESEGSSGGGGGGGEAQGTGGESEVGQVTLSDY